MYAMVGSWGIRFAAQFHGQALFDTVCKEKLIGAERIVTDQRAREIRRESIRRVVAADVSAVPAVLGVNDVGQNVCTIPTFWEEAGRAIVTFFGRQR
jgi:hypothetical protein